MPLPPDPFQLRAPTPSRGPVRALRAAAALGVVLLLGLAAACGRRGAQAGEGVLIVAIDALRADHLSGAGYDRATSPTLDELAAEGVHFTDTIAAAPWLVPAHIALLAGTDPNLGWRTLPEGLEGTVQRRWRIPPVVSTGAVEFLTHGWRTAAFSDHVWLAPGFGFARGFQTFEFSELEEPPEPGGSGAAGLVPKLELWLRSLRHDERWFAYLHLHDLQRNWRFPDAQWDTYFEPRPELDHVPPVGSVEPVFFAVPPSRWLGGSDPLGVYEARYDGGIRRLDGDLRRLFDTLRLIGRWERTTVCVVGSHGLQFGEAGMVVDSGRLSLADLAVPWILRPGEGAPFRPGHRVEAVASTMDVVPTLLHLAGLDAAPSMNGVSQAALLTGADVAPPREYAFASCGLQFGFAAFGERFAYERTAPGFATRAALVETWYGDERRDHRGQYELHYDRIETPFPSLLHRERAAPEESPVRAAAIRWFSQTEGVRRQVQRGALDHSVKVEALEELRRTSLLEETP